MARSLHHRWRYPRALPRLVLVVMCSRLAATLGHTWPIARPGVGSSQHVSSAAVSSRIELHGRDSTSRASWLSVLPGQLTKTIDSAVLPLASPFLTTAGGPSCVALCPPPLSAMVTLSARTRSTVLELRLITEGLKVKLLHLLSSLIYFHPFSTPVLDHRCSP